MEQLKLCYHLLFMNTCFERLPFREDREKGTGGIYRTVVRYIAISNFIRGNSFEIHIEIHFRENFIKFYCTGLCFFFIFRETEDVLRSLDAPRIGGRIGR